MDAASLGVGHGSARLRTPREDLSSLTRGDPAARLVTDFSRQQPATVAEHVTIDDALGLMKTVGVRALVVMRGDVVSGLITSYDIQGERAARFQQSANNMPHRDVEVGDIMTHWDQVPVLDWRWISRSQVQDVIAVFRTFTGSHVVVTEHAADGAVWVRGVISRTRLAAVGG